MRTMKRELKTNKLALRQILRAQFRRQEQEKNEILCNTNEWQCVKFVHVFHVRTTRAARKSKSHSHRLHFSSDKTLTVSDHTKYFKNNVSIINNTLR